jgi:DNA polymerase
MFINYKDEIEALQKRCYECKLCPLGQEKVDGFDPHVFSNGKVPSRVIFVAEAPGATETRKKIPLCGACGNYFNNEMLRVIGLERKNIYVSNAVKCRPEKNRTPTDKEITICRPHIDAEISLINPKLIVSLGNPALWAMCDIKAITRNRGEIHKSRKWSNGKTYDVFALYHPSYILRCRGKKDVQKDVQTDLINLKKIIGEL